MNAAMVNRIPTEAENGLFGGRETYLGTCDCDHPTCNAPTSYYVDDDTRCQPQTDEIQGVTPEMRTMLDAVKEYEAEFGPLPTPSSLESGLFAGLGNEFDTLGGGLMIEIGEPMVVVKLPGETTEEAIARALGGMMAGDSSGGNPLKNLFNSMPKELRNLGDLFGLMGQNGQRGNPQTGRFFDPDDIAAQLERLARSRPTSAQELDEQPPAGENDDN